MSDQSVVQTDGRTQEDMTGETTARYADAMLRKGPPTGLVADCWAPVSSQTICDLPGARVADRSRLAGNSQEPLRLDIGPQEARASLKDLVDPTADLRAASARAAR
ncbi:hypothetical protein [Streptomyces sp.]|uniref:hypothetical protein n=1 Tax=Streptomyces sp. TaxID=1931 RepID=UPI002F3EFE41